MKALIGMILAAVFALPAWAEDDLPQRDLVRGRYWLIGQLPDGGAAFSGSATIERVGDRLRLTRRVAGKTEVRWGVVRRADPGEAWVLAFAWQEKKPMEAVCVIGVDLDNYARLTCSWGIAGNPHRRPGMEAYFAREPWEPLN